MFSTIMLEAYVRIIFFLNSVFSRIIAIPNLTLSSGKWSLVKILI